MVNISFRNEGTHLVAVCEGVWESAATTDIILRVRDEARRTSQTKILADWRNVSAPRIELDRYLVGESVAKVLSFHFKVAALYPKNLINKLAENTAVNRGGRLFVCSDEDEAYRWLHAKDT